MNINNEMVLIYNSRINEYEDKTADINTLEFSNNQTQITFNSNEKTYRYHTDKVRVLKNPKAIALENTVICVDNIPLSGISAVQDFGEYIRVFDAAGKTKIYPRKRVSFQKSCLDKQNARAVFEYLKALSKYVNVTDEGRALLWDQYEKLSIVSEKSVLGAYLTSEVITKTDTFNVPIFPFGFNLSQKRAVEMAMENSISIIEGPPGTGKTQTILNIIANVVYQGQNVAVVSGNNSATDNVIEKLEKNGYGFMASLLGNQDKKKRFFEEGQLGVPDFTGWKCSPEERVLQINQLSQISRTLSELLKDRNELAENKEQLSKLETEQGHFLNAFSGNVIPLNAYSLKGKWTGESILKFLIEYRHIAESAQFQRWGNKFKLFFRYGIYKHRFIEQNQADIFQSLNSLYYESSIRERQEKVATLEDRLSSKDFEGLMKQYAELSGVLFCDALGKRYDGHSRQEYTLKGYKGKFQSFIRDYPVILSTTHSIRGCVMEHFLFDYLIIDEASQVDLVTAALAMSCCKNIVIVGDVKQLPQIVPRPIAQKSDELLKGLCLPIAFDYSQHSILSSLLELYGDGIPSTLLCEHYRCHPKIIRYCNEKFYDNQLVIMTEESDDDNALQLYRTAPGNHARRIGSGWYNQRQIEVVRDEVLGLNRNRYGDCSAVGIIAPYRDHITKIRKATTIPGLEADTVHKYQGREKDTIVFSTVSNDINVFVDDPNLINVAVSRAVKELIIVTSDKLFKQHGTNLGDLIRYIEYNSMDGAVVESKKISVFDMLYSEYSDMLRTQMKRMPNVSEHKSENLLYSVIAAVLGQPEFSAFKCVLHVPVRMIVKNVAVLNEREQFFVEHPWTHVDFLIFNKMDKEPVLVVEVDGYQFHQQNAKQLERDRLKDGILKQIELPILRISTNASGEKELLESKLREIIRTSVEQEAEDPEPEIVTSKI